MITVHFFHLQIQYKLISLLWVEITNRRQNIESERRVSMQINCTPFVL